MSESIFRHIEMIERRKALHTEQLNKSTEELRTAHPKAIRTIAKINRQIEYSKHQIAMIQKEWDFEDKMLREKHPDLFNMTDDELLKELLG